MRSVSGGFVEQQKLISLQRLFDTRGGSSSGWYAISWTLEIRESQINMQVAAEEKWKKARREKPDENLMKRIVRFLNRRETFLKANTKKLA